MQHNGQRRPEFESQISFRTNPDTMRAFAEVALHERRMTKLELAAKDHDKRLRSLEDDATMIRAAIWSLTRGLCALLFGLMLDQSLNAGAFVAALKAGFGW